MNSIWHSFPPFCKFQVSIRGPYGTPTREIFDTEHAVLIASGIGVTPYASILQSISYRVRAAKKTCPHCTKSFVDRDSVTGSMKLKKVSLFEVLDRFQHCTGHTKTGSWEGRGNQYTQLVKVLYCKVGKLINVLFCTNQRQATTSFPT